MAHMRSYRSTGRIERAAGAAVAALKARAAAWEVPLVEAPERLSLVLWGCELILMPQPDGVQIDLVGPEERLIGTLRDSATEIFAEVGLPVLWDHVDVGALAPGLSLMRVEAVSPLTPGFLRVRLSGPEAGRFASGGLHFRLLLPPAGRPAIWPRVAGTGRTVWPEGADALHRPVYTVAAQGADWLDFDIFRHRGSPTCDWAEAGPVGATVGIIGPGGGWCPEAGRLFLFGDETALPAIRRMLDLAGGRARAVLRCAAADLGRLAGDPRVDRSDDLLAALAAQEACGPDHFLWFAASADEARAARRHLQDRGVARARFVAAAYWS